jgi:6-pyruvoyltetrahydropterin/6-carboxytetrahydropterin synthase
MKLTRRVTFSSGHRYWKNDLDEAGNAALFGKWASKYNHGHNYVLEVTVSGKISDATGMVINIKEIDSLIRRRVVQAFDQKSLNDEVPYFADLAPTTENIASYVFSLLEEMPATVALEGVRLAERPDLYVEKSATTQMKLTRVYEFSASHRLHVPSLAVGENEALFGKCNNPAGHGHNYVVEITVEGTPNPETGMIADIGKIDDVVRREVVDRYDHKHLNEDIVEFRGKNPTTEVLTQTIWKRLSGKLDAKLSHVLVRETDRNIFEYSGEDE